MHCMRKEEENKGCSIRNVEVITKEQNNEAMEYTYEIIEALESYYEKNLEQFLPIIKELSCSVNDPAAKIKFELKIEDVCREYNLCSLCFEPLEFERFSESRGEYFGFPATETVYKTICNKCKN